MKNLFLTTFGFFSLLLSKITLADSGVLGGVSETQIKTGDIHLKDIPNIINKAIDFIMGFSGLIAIIFVIVGAYKILFGSLQQDKAKGRDTVIMALTGFAIAVLAWFIVKLVIDNFQ